MHMMGLSNCEMKLASATEGNRVAGSIGGGDFLGGGGMMEETSSELEHLNSLIVVSRRLIF